MNKWDAAKQVGEALDKDDVYSHTFFFFKVDII